MSVATDLQSTIARVSEAIAGRATYGRVELEGLRRDLSAIREAAAEDERRHFRVQEALGLVVEGINAGIADLNGLAKRARARQAESGAIVLAVATAAGKAAA